MSRISKKHLRIAAWIGIFCAIVFGLRTLRNSIPLWRTLKYDRFDGRVILHSFESKFSSIMAADYDRSKNKYLDLPQGSNKTETSPSKSVFCLMQFKYIHTVEPLWRRLKECQAEVEVKGVYLTRSGKGEYLGNFVSRSNFNHGGYPGRFGIGTSEINQDPTFNGALLADKVGSLQENSRLLLNQDFYFVQVYDQFRVYTVEELPLSIRSLMKGRIEEIFAQEAGSELKLADMAPKSKA